ncbi:MAG: metallophosphoesterase [Candidatus Latescibacteria bacterium]|nr:metallophosphoesterase [Candidatus Latescibacterota bacterium]
MPNEALLGIIADTHDNRPNIKLATRRLIEADVGHVIHAGDFIAPFTALDFDGLVAPFTGVYGNNDGERLGLANTYGKLGKLFAVSTELTVAGRKVYVRHEPDAIDAIADSGHYDIVIYGHTHQIDIRQAGSTWIVNPGECCGWVTERSTIVVFDLEKMEPTLIDL